MSSIARLRGARTRRPPPLGGFAALGWMRVLARYQHSSCRIRTFRGLVLAHPPGARLASLHRESSYYKQHSSSPQDIRIRIRVLFSEARFGLCAHTRRPWRLKPAKKLTGLCIPHLRDRFLLMAASKVLPVDSGMETTRSKTPNSTPPADVSAAPAPTPKKNPPPLSN